MTLDAETQKLVDQVAAQLPSDYADYLLTEVKAHPERVVSILGDIANSGFSIWYETKANAVKVTRVI